MLKLFKIPLGIAIAGLGGGDILRTDKARVNRRILIVDNPQGRLLRKPPKALRRRSQDRETQEFSS